LRKNLVIARMMNAQGACGDETARTTGRYMQPHRILLVEDDPRLGAEIADGLGRAGFVTDWIDDGLRARNVDLRVYSLVVLDLMLPGIHGFDLLKEWRQHSDVPVIILTARSDTHDKVRGFALGGDDYLT